MLDCEDLLNQTYDVAMEKDEFIVSCVLNVVTASHSAKFHTLRNDDNSGLAGHILDLVIEVRTIIDIASFSGT